MLKKDLIKEVAAAGGHTEKTVREVFDAAEAVVLRAIAAGKTVMLMGLGKLVTSRRGARPARNMKTGERMMLEPRNAVILKASEGLLRAANGAS